jgi:uncharacterized membrane protein
VLIAIVLIAAWVTLTLVLPILSALRVARAERQLAGVMERVSRLAEEVTQARAELARLTSAPTGKPAAVPPPSTESGVADGTAPPQPVSEPAAATDGAGAPAFAPSLDSEGATPRPVSLEARIGGRWLLYAGIATLILGASYFVGYAFENNWITPAMRVGLGWVAGVALAEAGRRFSARGLKRYGQITAGGGLAILYVATYAAFQLYALLSAPAAFTIMVGVTAFAAWRAHAEVSEGLAVLAATGGFATPFLIGGDAESPHGLFAYDAILVLGTLWLARRHEWPLQRLAAAALTGLTLFAWGERHYTSERWWSTELWLTLFAALFWAIATGRTPASPGAAAAPLPAWRRDAHRLARAVLRLTPLAYHAASLTILWPHPGGLLVYVVAATAAGTALAVHTGQSWIRLATWVLVMLPTLGWLHTRPGAWDTAPFIVLIGIYALHLAASWMVIPRRAPAAPGIDGALGSAPLPTIELLLLHLNGLGLWGGLAILLERFVLDRLGPVTFAVAAWHLALAAAARRDREAALHLLALAGALVAAGVAIELDGAALTVAWALEGTALAVLGLAAGRSWMQAGGGILLAAGVARLLGEFLVPAPAAAVPIVNARTFSAAVVAGGVGYLAWRYGTAGRTGRPTSPRLVATLVVTTAVLPLCWASAEIVALFARSAWFGAAAGGAGAVTSAGLARDVALSTLWAAYALLLVRVGIGRQYAPLRVLAIVLFGITVAKVFLVDLARLERGYRVLSTVALGLLLLGASYLYQRFTRQESGSV